MTVKNTATNKTTQILTLWRISEGKVQQIQSSSVSDYPMHESLFYLLIYKIGAAPVSEYFSVKFPRPRNKATTTTKPHLLYEGYMHYLDVGNDVQGEWALFSSQTEWELARWAKFQGISAGAFSDLLKVDGVS